jgi:hypothetical protein
VEGLIIIIEGYGGVHTFIVHNSKNDDTDFSFIVFAKNSANGDMAIFQEYCAE